MKKKSILVGLLAAGAVISLASCGAKQPVETSTSTQTATAKNLGQKVKVTFMNVDPEDETKKEEKEVTLDKVDASTNTAYGVVEAPKPTNPYKKFSGWYKDAELTNPANVSAITAEATFYGKWEPLYEEVKAGVGNDEGLTSWGALAASVGGANPITGQYVFKTDATAGPITFVTNNKARFEIKNNAEVLNTQGTYVKVTLSGEGTNNEIHGDGIFASSTAKDRVYLYKASDYKDADGKVTENFLEQTEEYSKAEGKLDVAFTWTGLAAGEYIIHCKSSVQYKNLYTVEKKEKAAPEALILEKGAVADYLVGSTFDKSGLTLKIKYKNLNVTTVDASDIVVDTNAVKFNEPGEYTVSYTVKDLNLAAVTQKVTVYAVDTLAVNDHVLNSSRVTLPVEQVFVKNSTFTSKNVSVSALGKVGDKVQGFDLKAAQYTITAPDMTTAGLKDVTVTSTVDTTKSATYKVLVVDAKLVADEGKVMIMVDPDATEVGVNGSIATVKTINQAMQLLQVSDLKDSDIKLVAVKPGTYQEKVEVNVANVNMINAYFLDDNDELKPEAFTTKATGDNKVVIVYDALNGELDANGVGHGTDGSASVSIRGTAKGFAAAGITFMNHYNTHELYLESKEITSNTQAVALLVEADESFFANCEISSYHDTLYAREGRQLYYNCYIEGRTDYIFGDRDVTAYFKDCTIHTLGANQDKNGGYVACNKGSNVNFGYIFDGCTFEADAIDGTKGVANATVSLGRTWDEGMRLVIMNSTISAAYAKADFKATTEGGKNTRYTEMNSGKSPDKARIYEYNNTGEGALTATEAKDYQYVTVLDEIGDAQKAFVSNKLAEIFSSNGKKDWGATWFSAYLAMPMDEADTPLYQVAGIEMTPAAIIITYGEEVDYAASVVDGYLSKAMVKELASRVADVEGMRVKAYTDAALTTPFDYTKKLEAITNIYIQLEELVLEYGTYTFVEGEIAETVELDDYITFVATSDKAMAVDTVDAAKAYKNYAGNDAETNTRLKTNGAAENAARYIKIDLSEYTGKVIIEVWGLSGNSSDVRTCNISTGSAKGGTVVKAISMAKAETGAELSHDSVTVDCGKVYYISSASGSISIYAISIKEVPQNA